MMKHLYIIFSIVFFPLISFGQNDYYLTDSTKAVGVKLIDGWNFIKSQQCQVKKGGKIIQYTPYEVKEYGFKDGRVYISKEIQIADSSKRVFLQRLQTGKTTLYFYRGKGIKTFFIQKDSTLFVEMPKKNTEEDYSIQLLNLTKDCPNVLDACKLARYNKKSLSKFFLWYNNCEKKPFPHFRYGILLGYEYFTLKPSNEANEDLESLDYNYNSGLSLGLFIDNPIGISTFSVRTELLLSKHNYSYHKTIDNIDLDFNADLISLNIPILLRYTYPSKNIRPFIDAGVIGMYSLKNSTTFYETTYEDNKMIITDLTTEIVAGAINYVTGETTYNETKRHLISNVNLGYCFGTGLKFKLNYKNSLFFEIRYNNTFAFKKYEISGIHGFNLITGISF